MEKPKKETEKCDDKDREWREREREAKREWENPCKSAFRKYMYTSD